jgi:hypothetical protein
VVGAAVGAVYGAFVELDDSIGDPAPRRKLPAGDSAPVRAKKK